MTLYTQRHLVGTERIHERAISIVRKDSLKLEERIAGATVVTAPLAETAVRSVSGFSKR